MTEYLDLCLGLGFSAGGEMLGQCCTESYIVTNLGRLVNR